MSPSLPPGLSVPPRYPARRRGPAPAVRAPWGAVELVVGVIYLMPALTYVPAFSNGPGRLLTRVAAYVVTVVAWLVITLQGLGWAVGSPYPAAGWLVFCAGWLTLMIAHPQTNTLMAGMAHVAMQIAVMAPVFWIPKLTVTTARLRRVVLLVFAFSAFSSVLGISQFYRPNLNPSASLRYGPEEESALAYKAADGRLVFRPQGLGLTPGSACTGGMFAAAMGTGLALGSRRWWLRPLYLALAGAGMAVIYLCQARIALFCAVFALVLMTLLFLRRGNVRRAALLAVSGGVLFAGSMAWALRAGGETVTNKFLKTFSAMQENAGAVYYSNRGHYLDDLVDYILPNYPLGAGVGRWGTSYVYFGIPDPRGKDLEGSGFYHAELQVVAWAVDGGLPLIVGYAGALVVALYASARVARTSPDPEIAGLAVTVTATGTSIALSVLNNPVFNVMDTGAIFWILLVTLDQADQRARAGQKQRQAARRRAQLQERGAARP